MRKFRSHMFSSGLGLAGILLFNACGGSSSNSSAQWKNVYEQTGCEAANPSFCSGTYGFTVDNTGNYTAGPAPSGAVAKGTITADELNSLSVAANAFLSSTTSAATCFLGGDGPIIPGSGDGVTVSSVSGGSYLIQVFYPGTCTTADSAKASELSTEVKNLRIKYYPRPFS